MLVAPDDQVQKVRQKVLRDVVGFSVLGPGRQAKVEKEYTVKRMAGVGGSAGEMIKSKCSRFLSII